MKRAPVAIAIIVLLAFALASFLKVNALALLVLAAIWSLGRAQFRREHQ